MNFNTLPEDKGFKSIIVTKCLTRTCGECTGSYISKILNHRMICRCSCGHTNNENSAIVDADSGRIKLMTTKSDLDT